MASFPVTRCLDKVNHRDSVINKIARFSKSYVHSHDIFEGGRISKVEITDSQIERVVFKEFKEVGK